jgi:hypothetical protein
VFYIKIHRGRSHWPKLSYWAIPYKSLTETRYLKVKNQLIENWDNTIFRNVRRTTALWLHEVSNHSPTTGPGGFLLIDEPKAEVNHGRRDLRSNRGKGSLVWKTTGSFPTTWYLLTRDIAFPIFWLLDAVKLFNLIIQSINPIAWTV